jgi:hypothetical protein
MGGGGGKSASGARLITLFLALFFLLLFVMGDSYPEFCAQRTAEGEGSHLLWFVSFVVSLATYPMEMKACNEI